MSRRDLRFHVALIFLAVVLFAGQVYLLRLTKQFETQKYLNHPPKYLEHFAFGFRLSMADSFWLRWIQDSDYCQTYGKKVVELDTPKAEATFPKDKDVLTYNPRHKICDDSWGFLMLDLITKLDPKFEMVYQGGAVMLSVLVEDYQGASLIFERGLAAYPNDWRIHYLAAYHYLFDRQDLQKAATLLNKAAELGAPSWLKSLASRLYQRSGQLELGIATLENYLKTLKDEEQIEKVRARIADLKAQAIKAQ